MGNNFNEKNFLLKSKQKINKSNFIFERILFKNKYLKIWKVKYKKTYKQYLIKEYSKLQLIDKNLINFLLEEKQILCNLNFIFITKLYFIFQDNLNLYFLMDYYSGGSLQFHLKNNNNSIINYDKEKKLKFILSNILLSLNYIHSKKIIYNNLNPKNLLLDNEGFINLIDFKNSKYSNYNNELNKIDFNNNKNLLNKNFYIEYLAPEIILNKKYNFSADYYSLGLIGYEIIFGKKPYENLNFDNNKINQIKNLIFVKNINLFKIKNIDFNYSNECLDFINKLLCRKPNYRLGYYGINEIFEHKWIKNVNWENLINKKIKSPFDINNNIEYFNQNVNKFNNDLDLIGNETIERYKKIFENYNEYNNYFNEFTNLKIPNEFIFNDNKINYIKENKNLFKIKMNKINSRNLKKNIIFNSYKNNSCVNQSVKLNKIKLKSKSEKNNLIKINNESNNINNINNINYDLFFINKVKKNFYNKKYNIYNNSLFFNNSYNISLINNNNINNICNYFQ